MSTRIHDTAIVDPGAVVGDETTVWHWSHVMATATIGEYCSLGQNVFVGEHVRIGDGSKIQNNVSLYDGVVLGNEVFVGPSAVFTNVRTPRAGYPTDDYAATFVGDGATIGANATVICGVTLGAYCFIAAGAVVTGDVEPYALMQGVPARRVGTVDALGEVVREPDTQGADVG